MSVTNVQMMTTMVHVTTNPVSISLRIAIPRSSQLFASDQERLELELESFFFLKPDFHDGIAVLHLEAWGNADGFHQRLEQLIGQLRMDICRDLRFTVEVEY